MPSLRRGASAAVAFVAGTARPSPSTARRSRPTTFATSEDRSRSPVVALAARDRRRRVLAALAVVLVVRWWRARSLRALSPLERARQALAAAEAHARAGRSREWAEIVAETLRGALAARLGTDVLPQTTAELSQAPWAQPPPPTSSKPRASSQLLGDVRSSRDSRRPASMRTRSSRRPR